MNIRELQQRCLDLGLVSGDPISLQRDDGSSVPVVFEFVRVRDGDRPEQQLSCFAYVFLDGLTTRYLGRGDQGNFEFDMPFLDVQRWEPTSWVDQRKVKSIRDDLACGTTTYIR